MRFSDLDDTPFSPTRVDYRLVGRILRIGSFVMLAMLTQFIVGAADALMVGSMSDVDRATAGQAALGLGTPLYWMVGGFFSAVGYGTQAITARRYGAHDDEAAGRVLSNSVVVGVLAGIMGGVVAYVTASPVDFLRSPARPRRISPRSTPRSAPSASEAPCSSSASRPSSTGWDARTCTSSPRR